MSFKSLPWRPSPSPQPNVPGIIATSDSRSKNRPAVEIIDLTGDDHLPAKTSRPMPSNSASSTPRLGHIVSSPSISAGPLGVGPGQFRASNSVGFTPRIDGIHSTPGIGLVSPSFGFGSPVLEYANDDEMFTHSTPEKLVLVLEEYYSHTYMNYLTDDIDYSSLEKVCKMDERVDSSDEGVFGFSSPTLAAVLERGDQHEAKLKGLKRVINSMVTKANYSALRKEVSKLLDKECEERKIAKWQPALSIPVKSMLLERDRVWKENNRKARNRKDEFEVRLFKTMDSSGRDFTVTRLWFEYKKSFASFTAVLQSYTSLQNCGGYTWKHGPWKYQIGQNFDLKGSVGDWKAIKDEETYKAMLLEINENKGNSGMKIGIFHSTELTAVREHSAEWVEWVREHEEFKRTQILDENGEAFFDSGSYLDYLRKNPTSDW